MLLKQSHGITRAWPTAGFAICALISFGLLTFALRKLEVGPAYAVRTGVGAAGTALVGMAVLGESVSVLIFALQLPPASARAWERRVASAEHASEAERGEYPRRLRACVRRRWSSRRVSAACW